MAANLFKVALNLTKRGYKASISPDGRFQVETRAPNEPNKHYYIHPSLYKIMVSYEKYKHSKTKP